MDLALNKYKISSFSISVLLFLMMIFQSQLYLLKIILLFIAFICSGKIICISKPVKYFVTILCIYGIWGMGIGLLNFNSNPFLGITTTFIWPLLFLKFINLTVNEDSFNTIIKIIFTAHCFIVIYDIIYAFSIIYGFYFPLIYNIDVGFSFYETSSRLNFVNLNTLTFTTPFLAMLLLSDYDYRISRTIQVLVLMLTLFLFILSGRRSVMLQLLLIPFFAFLYRDNLSKRTKRIFIRLLFSIITIIIITIILIYFYFYELFEGYLYTFLVAFDSSAEPIKFLQHQSLMRYFIESPICGHGFGAYFYDPGRNIYMNQMELQYQLSLAQTGIIGFLCYIIAIVGLWFYSFYLSKHNNDKFLLANSFGYLFVILSHATNPVLCSFDLMVSYFILLLRINFLYYKKHSYSLNYKLK